MKKVLSVVLAAAMVLGMSVSAFADVEFGTGTATAKKIGEDYTAVSFNRVIVVRDEKVVDVITDKTLEYDKLESGDHLFFPVRVATVADPKEKDFADLEEIKAPSNWVIRASSDTYVDDADFYYGTKDKYKGTYTDAEGNKGEAYIQKETLFVEVTLGDIDAFSNEDVDLYFYIYDTKTKERSEKVKVNYESYVNKITLTKDDLEWIITVDEPTVYTYKKGEKNGTATFNYEDLDVYFSAKLFGGDTYNVSATTKYNKDLSKEYDTDVEVISLTGDFARAGELVFKSSKDNKQVVMVEDDKLVPVEAEFVKNHKFANGSKVNGYVVETAELGDYALIDADIEIKAEEPAEEPTTTEPAKENPGTGASDFVGAAVALAVVSVAAAGALAFKK